MLTILLVTLLSYLVGSVPFGYLLGLWKGVDIFSQGSGNLGATNVGRVLGKKFGLLVFVLDFLKGSLPVLLAGKVRLDSELNLPPLTLPLCAGLAAFLGHLYPLYLRFRGGKGVATGGGAVFMLVPLPACGALAVWLALATTSRYVSLASLVAALSLTGLQLLTPAPFAAEHRLVMLFCGLLTSLVLWRHRSNLGRLYRGEENLLRESALPSSLGRAMHLLAVGLWFGMSLFFSFPVALSLFNTFWQQAELPAESRPIWLPTPEPFTREPSGWPNTEPKLFREAREVRREQGSRVAGVAISPIFDAYFTWQRSAGFLALVTAWGWCWCMPTKLNRRRSGLVLLAFLTVLVGSWLERKVHQLRLERNAKVDAVLLASEPSAATITEAALAGKVFFHWHLASQFLNLGTIVLVTIVLILAAWLPTRHETPPQAQAALTPTSAGSA